MLISAFIDYHILGELYILAYIAGLALLSAVLFLGADAKGAVRWLEVDLLGFSHLNLQRSLLFYLCQN